MKRSIEWHETVAKNFTASLLVKYNELRRVRAKYDRMTIDHNFYYSQIAEAVKQGKDGFDRHRFMKAHKKEANGNSR